MPLVTPSKSRTLSGITDLTLLAPVKRGLIEALDTRSYASRARLVMRTLNNLRMSSREAEPTPLVADLVDRVQAIHSFRVALIDQEPRQILLNVVFDGGWEPYMRRIWRDLGPLLDLIFCNCEGYRLSFGSRFADYAAWVRSAQIETDFFYTAAPVTVGDLHYLRSQEHKRLTGEPVPPPAQAASLDELLEQAMPALVALYRLSDMHPPDASDGDAGDGGCLLRAARRLLGYLPGGLFPRPREDLDQVELRLASGNAASEKAAVEWFYRDLQDAKTVPGDSTWTPAAVQGGIVEPYPDISHGCLLLLGLRDAAAAQALLDHLLQDQRLLRAADRRSPWSRPPAPYHNVAFTLQGLQVAGVPEGLLGTLPAEFREGMAARAGILGDVDVNHPTRWSLPLANWRAGAASGLPIELSAVHAVVQIQVARTPAKQWVDLTDKGHPLYETVFAFGEKLATAGVRILAVQAMQRFPAADGLTTDAFGFVDGTSQPRLDPVPEKDRDRVATGDLLLGHRNSLGDEPALTGRLWNDGSFLVLRKLRQDVKAFEAVAGTDEPKTALMGRTPTGEVTLGGKPVKGNDFDFQGDPDGMGCPFASHIRRANPREQRVPDLPAIPRILRRGMSWGPRDGSEACGLMFMAYNASIAEQFEVIQGWLAGGNSSGAGLHSGQRDPLLGVPLAGDAPVFEYFDGGARQTIRLPAGRPFAKLDWGLYLFVPSIAALAELRETASEAGRLDAAVKDTTEGAERERRRRELHSLVAQRGAAVINQLRRAEQVQPLEAARDLWKTALEDIGARMSGTSEAIWAAVAEVHGGALRTPFGVLVASAPLVQQVLADADRRYTASGYNQRLAKSFGPIYLGLDDDRPQSEYRTRSTPINDAILAVGEAEAFADAYTKTREVVAQLLGVPPGKPPRVEVRDLVDAVLAALCEKWFGIPDGSHVRAGGWHWSQQANCPGHFGAPSRYTFQPNPGPSAVRVGQAHGRKLAAQVGELLASNPPSDTGRSILKAIRQANPSLVDQASTLIGVMMGFLPTVDGNLRGALFEWVEDRSLWQLQLDLFAALDKGPFDDPARVHPQAQAVLGMPLARTLHLRPVPEMVWRVATAEDTLGNVKVQPGDLVVAGLVGALQQRLAEDKLDLSFLFGGYRPGGTGSVEGMDLALLMSPPDSGRPTKAPTHACPGYRIAWGVMLGFVAGLLCSARLRPTLTSMSLRLEPLP